MRDGVEAAFLDAGGAGELIDTTAGGGDQHEESRYHGQCRQRESRVHPYHHDEHAGEQDGRGDNRENPVHRDGLEREGIVGDPHHQVADLAPAMEGERESLQVVEHLRAQVVHHPLSDGNGDVVGGDVENPERDIDHDQRQT